MDSSPRSSLSIGDLSVRTGVPVTTLRSWETRYGFPRATRAGGGHRRYEQADVDAVLEVIRHRDAGLSLAAAVRLVDAQPVGPGSGSVYAELRRRHPDLAPQLLSKAALVALSRAVEDECCARAAVPVLFGGFQHEKHLRASLARWTDLARTARSTAVFAEPARSADARRAPVEGGPVEVALPPGAPLTREWLVICDAPDLPACLAAVERPRDGRASDAARRFEVVWSVDPAVVRDASRVATALAGTYRPGWRGADDDLVPDDAAPASADLRRASELFNRMLGYLETARTSAP
ncbi:DICT sensory domain-containing protein [Nocardioides sp. SYSU D00065]|uniref:DICT sensory domain-containing protein n=1 Tax=Nocardioides sp. SYSU D00065 TaxID=2817378 RepID=UPI001B30CD73|nr:DICT sensory domain-containing protein [Nocardioides sp. SYSU D00065]